MSRKLVSAVKGQEPLPPEELGKRKIIFRRLKEGPLSPHNFSLCRLVPHGSPMRIKARVSGMSETELTTYHNNERLEGAIKSDPAYVAGTHSQRKKIMQRSMDESEYLELVRGEGIPELFYDVSHHLHQLRVIAGDGIIDEMAESLFPQSKLLDPDSLRRIMDRDRDIAIEFKRCYSGAGGNLVPIPTVLRYMVDLEDASLIRKFLGKITLPLPLVQGHLRGGSKVSRIARAIESGKMDELFAEMDVAREQEKAMKAASEEKIRQARDRKAGLAGMVRDIEEDPQMMSLFFAIPEYYRGGDRNRFSTEWGMMYKLVRKKESRDAIAKFWKRYEPSSPKDKKEFGILSGQLERYGAQLSLAANVHAYFEGQLDSIALKESLANLGIEILEVSDKQVKLNEGTVKRIMFPEGARRAMDAAGNMLDETRISMAWCIHREYKRMKKAIS